ncbi:piggyBac transposable element-derived protein 4-like, partial [Aphis craccivora]
PHLVSSDMTHTECVIEQLMEDHFYKGHSLFMDNYYNSVKLAHQLLEKKTYCTGTLRSNRTNNPKSWKDRREVLTISSEFKGETVEETNRRGTIKMKPETIVQYNRFMSGIDRQNQMMAYYPCERKTLRCVINSLLLIQSNTTIVPQIQMSSDTHFPNKYCASKGIRAETIYFCPKYEDNPGLCIEPCFERYHQNDTSVKLGAKHYQPPSNVRQPQDSAIIMILELKAPFHHNMGVARLNLHIRKARKIVYPTKYIQKGTEVIEIRLVA